LNARRRALFSPDCVEVKLLPPVALAMFTLVTRVLCRGSVYWADGPAHIRCILGKAYVIQPPGYWLFNRIAGLFPNPITAISVMNILFSVAAVVVFYYAALFFTGRRNAFLAALAYSSIFFIWFSGEVHSTYASQTLFPVFTFYALLCYERDKASRFLWLAAVLFATGAGFRPSDGAFLFPMLVYFSAVRLPRKRAAIFLATSIVLCFAWFIPTELAYRHSVSGLPGVGAYMSGIVKVRSIMTGVNAYSMANITRYVLPLLVAFWPILTIAILNMIHHWEDWRIRMMFLWILPGSLFFTLSYMSNAPYLNFLSAALVLLAVSAPRMMAVTAVWNAVLFLSFSPIPSQRLIVNVWNCYTVEYTRYAIEHQWDPNLSQIASSIRIGQLNTWGWTGGCRNPVSGSRL
jgi:4-amino-4-deoxy-L-arabinose transferase-like glycosyltransferase